MKSNVEQAIESIAQLLTATHDHGSWKPGIVISYLGPNFAEGGGWYIALNQHEATVMDSSVHPMRTTLFNGKFETLREALKAAVEFLAPIKLNALKNQVQALAEKL